MSRGFARDSRITRGPDLQRVLKEGKRIRTRFLDVRIHAFPLDHSGRARIGIIVPKARHTAVERNQLKRRLRELARLLILPFVAPAEIVLLARGDTYRAGFDLLTADIERLVQQLQVLSVDTE